MGQPACKLITDQGEAFCMEAYPVLIGRSPDCQVRLEDETVSMEHAAITYDDQSGAFVIGDLDSLNGLYINNQPTRMNFIYDGLRIRLGLTTLTFRETI